MKPKSFLLIASVFALVALLMIGGSAVMAQGPQPHSPEAVQTNGNADGTFTYQGQLKYNGSPYNGNCDFKFYFYDVASGGSAVASETVPNVAVSNGLFSAPVPYHNWGPQRWLEVAVSCPAFSGSYTTLSPREEITAAPYANSLRPGSETASFDASGHELTDVYISDNTNAGIRTYAYYTGTPGLAAYTDANVNTPGILGVSSRQGNGFRNFGVVGLASTGTYTGVSIDYDAGGAFSGPNGVIGVASPDTDTGWGVYGVTTGTVGTGVRALASASTGANYGVVGVTNSDTGTGVKGVLVHTTPNGLLPGSMSAAVWGDTNTGIGVAGSSSSTGGAAVVGVSTGSGATVGVRGRITSTTGYAGWFDTTTGNGVYVSAPVGKIGLTVAGGTKNAVVGTNDGSRLLYTEESTEVWFTDYGFGQLANGVAVIAIDPLFAQTVNLQEPYHVFVQVYGDAEVYVSNRTPTQFEVHLHGTGDANVEFSYRIVAKRLSYENTRLAPAPWADNDPNLYPSKQSNALMPGQVQPGDSSAPANLNPDQSHNLH